MRIICQKVTVLANHFWLDIMAEDDVEDSRRKSRVWLLLWKYRSETFLHPVRLSFRQLLTKEGRKRRERSLPRNALPNPIQAPWETVFQSNDDSALITVTGMDHEAFGELLQIYKPYFDQYTPWTGEEDSRTFM